MHRVADKDGVKGTVWGGTPGVCGGRAHIRGSHAATAGRHPPRTSRLLLGRATRWDTARLRLSTACVSDFIFREGTEA